MCCLAVRWLFNLPLNDVDVSTLASNEALSEGESTDGSSDMRRARDSFLPLRVAELSEKRVHSTTH